jgi:hypothetical protein
MASSDRNGESVAIRTKTALSLLKEENIMDILENLDTPANVE